MNNNLSVVADYQTAKTCSGCAKQRAENLYLLGSKSVLELCVGPSLKILECEYRKFGINVTGNDLDLRWKRFYPSGQWIVGNALNVDYSDFDTVVFAPPLTKGCTGLRKDSLPILDINPKYQDFLERASSFNGTIVLVLPGRSLSTKLDRDQFFNLKSKIFSNHKKYIEFVPLKFGNRKIIKYYDWYLQ